MIVGRLARNADPAGTAQQTGNGRLNLGRAITDTQPTQFSPQALRPAGGGPLVGPYVAAAKNLTLTFAGSVGGTIAFSSFVPAGAPAACTATCTRALDNNQRGTMTVTPSPGSTFAGWSGTWDPSKHGTTTCAGTTTPCTFFMGDTGGADQNSHRNVHRRAFVYGGHGRDAANKSVDHLRGKPVVLRDRQWKPLPHCPLAGEHELGIDVDANLSGATSSPLNLTKPGVALSGNQYRAVFTNTCSGTQTATTNRGSP